MGRLDRKFLYDEVLGTQGNPFRQIPAADVPQLRIPRTYASLVDWPGTADRYSTLFSESEGPCNFSKNTVLFFIHFKRV